MQQYLQFLLPHISQLFRNQSPVITVKNNYNDIPITQSKRCDVEAIVVKYLCFTLLVHIPKPARNSAGNYLEPTPNYAEKHLGKTPNSV